MPSEVLSYKVGSTLTLQLPRKDVNSQPGVYYFFSMFCFISIPAFKTCCFAIGLSLQDIWMELHVIDYKLHLSNVVILLYQHKYAEDTPYFNLSQLNFLILKTCDVLYKYCFSHMEQLPK